MRLKTGLALLLTAALAVTGCAGGVGNQGQGTEGTDTVRNNTHSYDGSILSDGLNGPFPPGSVSPLQNGTPQQMGMLQNTYQQPAIVQYEMHNGAKYISVDDVARILEYEHVENDDSNKVRLIGDRDVIFKLTAGSKDAEKEGDSVTLADPPVIVDGRMLISLPTLSDLFKEEMEFGMLDEGLVIYPMNTLVLGRDTDDEDEAVDDSLDFGDDPDDPFAGESAEGVFSRFGEDDFGPAALEALANDPEAMLALKNINIDGMIKTAKRYMGVKYKFGAGPYPKSNRFDCSSYTQYVFKKYGINLPRTARAQARIGKTVSRKNLRKGDLLFFYVPGRFKSNKTIGHVGIYIGNNMMIHANTEPKNGVQLRSINRAFWKKTFIKAKRIAY